MNISPKLNVIFEDNHLIAINKENNVLVQGDKTGDESLDEKVKNYIKIKYNKPGNVFLGVIHRIDRPVSGIVIFARTSKALTRMNEALKNRNISKEYIAIVSEKPPAEEGTLKNYLKRNSKQNKSYAYNKVVPDSKEAILKYKMSATSDKYYLLSVQLITGRHHQIRSQLSNIGCPIKGDLKYGFPRSNSNGGISLHSYKMSFTHPVTKEEIKLVATPPNDNLWDFFKQQLS